VKLASLEPSIGCQVMAKNQIIPVDILWNVTS